MVAQVQGDRNEAIPPHHSFQPKLNPANPSEASEAAIVPGLIARGQRCQVLLSPARPCSLVASYPVVKVMVCPRAAGAPLPARLGGLGGVDGAVVVGRGRWGIGQECEGVDTSALTETRRRGIVVARSLWVVLGWEAMRVVGVHGLRQLWTGREAVALVAFRAHIRHKSGKVDRAIHARVGVDVQAAISRARRGVWMSGATGATLELGLVLCEDVRAARAASLWKGTAVFRYDDGGAVVDGWGMCCEGATEGGRWGEVDGV